jgi:nicotinamide-nucleotide amidase
MFDAEILRMAGRTLEAARTAGAMIITAESCTGGLVAAALTAVPGSSDAVDGGFVTYSNAAKARLGVDEPLIAEHGAVSEPVARALARAARRRALEGGSEGSAPVAVSVTGVAGPGGGSAHKPVGLVHFAVADEAGTGHRVERFGAIGRDAIRRESVIVALDLVTERLAAR